MRSPFPRGDSDFKKYALRFPVRVIEGNWNVGFSPALWCSGFDRCRVLAAWPKGHPWDTSWISLKHMVSPNTRSCKNGDPHVGALKRTFKNCRKKVYGSPFLAQIRGPHYAYYYIDIVYIVFRRWRTPRWWVDFPRRWRWSVGAWRRRGRRRRRAATSSCWTTSPHR